MAIVRPSGLYVNEWGELEPIPFHLLGEHDQKSHAGKSANQGEIVYSSQVAKYLYDQYQMDTDTARKLGLRQKGSKLLIPFKDENGKVTAVKWRDTAVLTKEQGARWGPPNSSYGLSVYENETKKGPIFVVESPSEGLILAAKKQRVVFFDGADTLVSRDGKLDSRLHNRLTNIVKGQESILIPDNDVRGEAFAQVVEKVTTKRVNPPKTHKDLRDYLINGGSVEKLIK